MYHYAIGPYLPLWGLRKSRSSVFLNEHDLGAKTADLCRKHGISEATFYNWKSKFGRMDVSEAKAAEAAPGRERQTASASSSGPSIEGQTLVQSGLNSGGQRQTRITSCRETKDRRLSQSQFDRSACDKRLQ
jgi:putative transposase